MKLNKLTTYLGVVQYERLQTISVEMGTSMSKLIAMAIDNELMKDKPFGDYDLTIPTDEFIEFAYADEAGKLLNYLKTSMYGVDLRQMMLLRHDMGIPERKTLLYALRECIEKGLIALERKKKKAFLDHDTERFAYKFSGDLIAAKIAKKARKKDTRMAKMRAVRDKNAKIRKEIADEIREELTSHKGDK